jgi:hypothetical protein
MSQKGATVDSKTPSTANTFSLAEHPPISAVASVCKRRLEAPNAGPGVSFMHIRTFVVRNLGRDRATIISHEISTLGRAIAPANHSPCPAVWRSRLRESRMRRGKGHKVVGYALVTNIQSMSKYLDSILKIKDTIDVLFSFI